MKRILFLVLTITLFSSCLENDDPNYEYRLLPIESSMVPTSFKFNTGDTIKVTYNLPSGCYQFDNLYYEYKDTARIVAIRAIEHLEINCTQAIIEKEFKFPVQVKQRQDYVFKFWKGKDINGEDVFEEKVVEVTN